MQEIRDKLREQELRPISPTLITWNCLYSIIMLYSTCAVLNKKRTTGTRKDMHHGHYTGHSSTSAAMSRSEVLRTKTYCAPQQTNCA